MAFIRHELEVKPFDNLELQVILQGCAWGEYLPVNPMRAPEIVNPLKKAIKDGKQLIRQDIGQPGEDAFDFVPSILAEEFKNSKNFQYSYTEGEAYLRNVISDYYQVKGINIEPDWILVGFGASEIYAATQLAVLRPGDRLATADPYYCPFAVAAAAKGVRWIPIETDPEDNFHPKKGAIQSVMDQKPQAVYICSPNNPNGTVLREAEIEKMLDLALRGKGLILADGVYSNYNYSKNPDSVLSFIFSLPTQKQETILDQSVILDSASKLLNLCGLRVGWGIIKNKEIRDAIYTFLTYRGSGIGQIQRGVAKILGKVSEHPELLQIVKENYRRKRDIFYFGLGVLVREGLVIIPKEKPEGSIYFPWELTKGKSATDFFNFCMNLKRDPIVTFVPMTTSQGSFYLDPEKGQSRIRSCYGTPVEELPNSMKLLQKQVRLFFSQ